MKTFSTEVLSDIFFEDSTDGYKLITKYNDTGFSDKYDTFTLVFKDLSDGKHYQCMVSRSGYYYSDYDYYFDNDCEEVECRTVVTEQWVPKQQGESNGK